MLNQNLGVLGHKNDDGLHEASFQKGKLINLNLTILFFYSKKRTDDLHLFHELKPGF